MDKMHVVLVLMAALCCVLMQPASAVIHVVGGSQGWEIPPNATFYAEWAQPRTFGVGDKIVFPFRTGAHNVIQVSAKDFDNCGNEQVVDQWARGPTIILLNTTGDYYFYSGVGTHCEMGQKLHISVGSRPGSSGWDIEDLGLAYAPESAPPPAHGADDHKSFASTFATKGAVLTGVVFCVVLSLFFM